MTERRDVWLESLNCGKWRLRAPLILWQTESGYGYVVGNHSVQLCGTGDTPEEALVDYARNLIEFAEHIERQHRRLMEIMAVSRDANFRGSVIDCIQEEADNDLV